MKDIHISEISNAEFLVNDDDNDTFDKIIYNYINIHTNKNIAKIWLISYLFDLDDEEEEFDEYIIDVNNMNLSLIKKYAPEFYNTYEYDVYPEYDEDYKNIYLITLNICGEILKNHFNDRFYTYINELEGAELSGADTDDDN